MVLNLKTVNVHTYYVNFKMEIFEQAIRIINRNDFLTSIDLRHAYYSVKIAEEQQKYLCSKWRETIYQFTCLPNGATKGPRLFTKLMKPVFANLREKGYVITTFLRDDTLICSKSREDGQECVQGRRRWRDTMI